MPYEMGSLLQKCDVDDFEVLIKQIDSYVNFTSDDDLKSLFLRYRIGGLNTQRTALVQAIEREIRYLGSADVAYALRKARGEEPAGVSVDEIIADVSEKLKVKQKLLGSAEAKLERLVKVVAERTFFSLSIQEQRELFEKAAIDKKVQGDFFDRIKRNKAHFLPLLLSLLGPEVTAKIVQGLAVSAMTSFFGRKAAEELIKSLSARFPLWAQWLGPIVWPLSLGWLAFDLQGSAYRKTIPILLYLGIVGLRDGPEDGEKFWEESTEV